MIHDSQSHHNSDIFAKITHWRCPNCGQIFFTTSALSLPSNCGICHKAIEWEELGDHPRRWRCPNCGQIFFSAPDEQPPDMCNYCQDFTTWMRIYD